MVTIMRVGLALAAWSLLIGADAHPIHAARVELVTVQSGAVGAVVRVYHEDFAPGENFVAISAYLDRTLVLTTASGSRVMLRPVATAREGDRLRIHLVGWSHQPVSGGSVQVTILQDKFDDQVNVVDARLGPVRQQMVFVGGDSAQRLD